MLKLLERLFALFDIMNKRQWIISNNIPKINGSQNGGRAAAVSKVEEFAKVAKEKLTSAGEWVILK